jgi:hypothetical protein
VKVAQFRATLPCLLIEVGEANPEFDPKSFMSLVNLLVVAIGEAQFAKKKKHDSPVPLDES